MNWIQNVLNASHVTPETLGGVLMLAGCAIVVVIWDWISDLHKSRKKSRNHGKSL